MRIAVLKFGGTSLSTEQARMHAFKHVFKAREQGYRLVVVVSAMGRKGDPYATDTLLDLIHQNGASLPDRETDMLLACGELISAATLCSTLLAQSIPTTVLTGAQAGILTDRQFGNAQILSIQPKRIIEQLEQDKVVIVTGFQGKTADDEFTTLGRGGSDTSATALGAALNAETVDIFTDVEGILTADPRVVSEARPLAHVTYSEMCNMAYNGAKVVHPRAVEIAMQAGVPMRVRSTFSDDEGTLVVHNNQDAGTDESIRDRFVTAIAQMGDIAQIKVYAREGQFDLQLRVFKALAEHRISVDFINVNPNGVVFTVFDHELERAVRILHDHDLQPHCTPHCAKVAVIGGGMNGVPGIMANIVEALTQEDIRILQTADSNATIWVLVSNADMVRAVRALHAVFLLHKNEKNQ